MEAYASTTVEMDNNGYEDLATQLIESKGENPNQEGDIREKSEPKERERPSHTAKKYVLRKGDQTFELDDDYELEMMADKRPMKLTLRELKDRAAGDVAVKNRMHALAEEKKRVQATFKEFASLAKNDPLGALEYISSKAKEADGDFEYNKYVEMLADQAEKLGEMNDEQRKAHELEKKLKRAEQDLSQKERQQAVVLRKQDMLSNYPEIGDSEFGQMVTAVLDSDELLNGAESEHDVMDRVEDLIQETLTQRDIMSVIRDINPSYLNDNQLIFSLSDQLRQNPDLNEEDVRDILGEIIGKKAPARTSRADEREKDIRTLSSKQRQASPVRNIREQNADPYRLLEQQLLEKRDELRKTPIYKR
ncbi:MAG TPA: hypothetical protein PKW79_07765 [Rhabdochlamydiaceae bacterium]|nr:hypothetical protein [Rhabdochlamydiaceae bacterium]